MANAYSIELLKELHALGWSTATELAREMGIHVATAMRKLAELEPLGLLEKRTRTASRVVEYSLARPRLEIILDIEAEARRAAKGAWGRAEKLFVKEKPNKNVVVEADEQEGQVRQLVFVKGLRWRTVARKLELTDREGRFLWHMPFGSQKALPVAEVCRQAGIKFALQVSKILEFVEEMERLGVVEIVR